MRLKLLIVLLSVSLHGCAFIGKVIDSIPAPPATEDPADLPPAEPPEEPAGSICDDTPCADGEACIDHITTAECIRICVPPDIVTGCVHRPPGEDWQYIPPEPEAPPVPLCTPTPRAGVYWLNKAGKWVADATPKLCGCDYCEQFNDCMVPHRYCCPVGCESDESRLDKELRLMGGPPKWTLEVEAGALRLIDDPWKGVVAGSGKGRIRWCFPNGKACSDWLEIEK